ncbi:MAG: hypothetical protein JSW64_05400 [Candidatus Zixiibacteriota bacterium]|nr:MAG: hypothetical protein JSW64_05400 [candidate division Zixibacteria bacterium]
MRKLTVSEILSISVLFWAFSGCSHIPHRARVSEGLNLSGAIIQDYETAKPPETPWDDQDDESESTEYLSTEYLINLGYASKLRNERKFMVYLNMAAAKNARFPFMMGAGFYYQLTPDSLPFASGTGAIVLGDPLVYTMWGRKIGKSTGIDLAAGFSFIPSLFFHAKLLQEFGPIQFGIIGEYRRFWGSLNFCYEGSCTYIKSESYIGIILIPEFR